MRVSCGIFFVDLPGVYTLNKNLGDIHARDFTGVLMWADKVEDIIEDTVEDDEDVVAPAHGADAGPSDESDEGEDLIRKNGGFDRIDDNAGPGQSLTTYLPKEDSLAAKMRPSVSVSEESAAVADSRGGDREKGVHE